MPMPTLIPSDREVLAALDVNAWGHPNAPERLHEVKSLQARLQSHISETKAAAATESRQLHASEARAIERAERYMAQLKESVEDNRVDRSGVAAPVTVKDSTRYSEGQPLKASQTFTGYAQAMGHKEPRQVQDALEEAGRDLSLAKCLHGAFTGDWRNAEPERIVMALSGASAGAGGVLLPTVLTSRIIDLARAKTRVLQAGAQIVPMENRTLDVARWLTDPAMAWRAENASIAESDPTMDKVTLTAKTLAAVTKVSRELVEDTDIEDQLESAFASALALEVDRASLYGTGASNQPTGVKNTAAVTKTPLATNGATPTWDALVASVGRLRDNNEEPTAQIMADRTLRSLAAIKDTTGQYVAPPSYLSDVPRLATNQVPLNLTVGTSNDTSDVFTADWTELFIGVRTQLQITLLTERYMPDAGQYGFVAWWRGDMAVARPKAFDVVTGVRP